MFFLSNGWQKTLEHLSHTSWFFFKLIQPKMKENSLGDSIALFSKKMQQIRYLFDTFTVLHNFYTVNVRSRQWCFWCQISNSTILPKVLSQIYLLNFQWKIILKVTHPGKWSFVPFFKITVITPIYFVSNQPFDK